MIRARGPVSLGVAVADYQPTAVFAALGGERRDIGVNLGLQRLGQHPPGAFAHDLIDQRRRAGLLPATIPRAAVSHYCEHGCAFPASVAAPAIA
jgi:hypothetical protein